MKKIVKIEQWYKQIPLERYKNLKKIITQKGKPNVTGKSNASSNK